MSVASEFTGKAQTCRNELFALFGIWIPWVEKSLPKNAWEEADKALRNEARKLYVGELLKRGVTVAYQRFANGTQSVTVSWDSVKMEREVKDDGRSAARNSFVALLRKRVESQMTNVTTWPIPDRPLTDPRNGGGALPLAKPDGADVDYTALQAQMMYAHSSGVHRPAPSAKSKSSVAGGKVCKVMNALLQHGGVAPGAMHDAGMQVRVHVQGPEVQVQDQGPEVQVQDQGPEVQVQGHEVQGPEVQGPEVQGPEVQDPGPGVQDQGPGSVALLFATEQDVQNGAAWEQWLLSAPPKSYTIYVHAQHPGKVITPLFKDSLVNEAAGGDGASGDQGGQQSSNGTGATCMTPIMRLLQEALKERANKWFMVLDGECLPMVGFGTFFTRMAQNPTTSVFEFHPEKVQTEMLSVLEFVADVPPLVRDAIENKDFIAHSVTGTMLVRRDAEILASASCGVLREWESALNSDPVQDALFSPQGAKYFGHYMRQEETSDVDSFFVREPGAAPASLKRSLCLSVAELWLFALLRRLSRVAHGEACAHKQVSRVPKPAPGACQRHRECGAVSGCLIL